MWICKRVIKISWIEWKSSFMVLNEVGGSRNFIKALERSRVCTQYNVMNIIEGTILENEGGRPMKPYYSISPII